jgi:hypothetical protein
LNPLKKQKRKFKNSIARSTGIPTTKSGRKNKADNILNKVGGWLILIIVIVYFASGK